MKDLEKIPGSPGLWMLRDTDWTAVWNAATMKIAYVRTAAGKSLDTTDIEAHPKLRMVCFDTGKASVLRNLPDIYAMKLIVTSRCNLACRYCFVKEDASVSTNVSPRDMDDGIVDKSLASFAEQLRISSRQSGIINIYGGEPLLVPHTVRRITKELERMRGAGAFDRPVELVLETNGTCLGSSMATDLAKAGATVVVSIDGPSVIHDHSRPMLDGRGSLAASVRGFRRARAAGAVAVVSGVLGHHNIDHLEEVVRFVRTELECTSLGINMQHPRSDGTIVDPIDNKTLASAYVSLLELGSHYGVYIEQAFRRVRPFVEETRRSRDCPSAGCRVVVRPDGMVSVCEAMSMNTDSCVGSVDTWSSGVAGSMFSEWYNRTVDRLETCRGCPAAGLCGAGCPYNALVLHGNIGNVDQRFCSICHAALMWCIRTLASKLDVVGCLRNGQGCIVPTSCEKRVLYGTAPVDRERTPLWSYTSYVEH